MYFNTGVLSATALLVMLSLVVSTPVGVAPPSPVVEEKVSASASFAAAATIPKPTRTWQLERTYICVNRQSLTETGEDGKERKMWECEKGSWVIVDDWVDGKPRWIGEEKGESPAADGDAVDTAGEWTGWERWEGKGVKAVSAVAVAGMKDEEEVELDQYGNRVWDVKTVIGEVMEEDEGEGEGGEWEGMDG